MKIIVLDGYTLNPGDISWKEIEAFGEVVVYERTAPEKVIERIGDAELVYTNKTVITREIMKACPQVKYIGVLATGYNVVDVEAAKDLGIVVTNVPGYGTEAVAQFTMALLLELCHRIGSHSDAVHGGQWSKSMDFCFWNYPQMELAGKTLGIIGYGRIGQAVAKMAEAFGMKVIVLSREGVSAAEGTAVQDGWRVDRETFFASADVISLHCPLNAETEGIICRETLEKMKKGVLILNASRGPLIVEQDLREALEKGKVGGAAADVVSLEPIQQDNPLLGAPNMILTPHIAWAARESRIRLMNIAAQNLGAFLAGAPINVVN